MKFFFFASLLVLSTTANAQFAIISDKDGSTNVRAEATTQSMVKDTLKNGRLIYCMENKGNWTFIDYKTKNKELSGYVYNDRYRSVSKFPPVPLSAQTGKMVKFKKDSIEVIVTEGVFDKSKHKFKYYKDAPVYIELIDNKQYWGTDGEMPKTQYKNIQVKIGKSILDLPKSALENLYEVNLDGTETYFDKERNIIYILSSNSDGAGHYEVIWKIENGVYKDRLIIYGF